LKPRLRERIDRATKRNGSILSTNGVGTNFGVGVGGEARRAGSRDMEFLGRRGQPAPPHQLGGLRDRCKLSHNGVRGGAPAAEGFS